VYFGKRRMVRFPRDMRFTISVVYVVAVTQTIWSFLRGLNTLFLPIKKGILTEKYQ
jgi:hypothetical protein